MSEFVTNRPPRKITGRALDRVSGAIGTSFVQPWRSGTASGARGRVWSCDRRKSFCAAAALSSLTSGVAAGVGRCRDRTVRSSGPIKDSRTVRQQDGKMSHSIFEWDVRVFPGRRRAQLRKRSGSQSTFGSAAARYLNFDVTHHLSPLVCHLSLVTCHLSGHAAGFSSLIPPSGLAWPATGHATFRALFHAPNSSGLSRNW